MSSIFLKFKYDSQDYLLDCNPNDSFSLIFEKFRQKAGINNSNLTFAYKIIILKPEMKLSEIKAKNNSIIKVIENQSILGGGMPINFTDLSKNIHEEIYFSKTAPNYRIVCKGINIEGICKSKKCEAFKKKVIVPLKNKEKFDLIEERDELECPICENLIVPKTVLFHLCKYKIKGKKIENDINSPFEFSGVAESKNSTTYFNPDENGGTLISELKIEVIKYL